MSIKVVSVELTHMSTLPSLGDSYGNMGETMATPQFELTLDPEARCITAQLAISPAVQDEMNAHKVDVQVRYYPLSSVKSFRVATEEPAKPGTKKS